MSDFVQDFDFDCLSEFTDLDDITLSQVLERYEVDEFLLDTSSVTFGIFNVALPEDEPEPESAEDNVKTRFGPAVDSEYIQEFNLPELPVAPAPVLDILTDLCLVWGQSALLYGNVESPSKSGVGARGNSEEMGSITLSTMVRYYRQDTECEVTYRHCRAPFKYVTQFIKAYNDIDSSESKEYTMEHCQSGRDERNTLKKNWKLQDASIQGMMLNTRSAELSDEDVYEILSYLPAIEGLDVVELGAGIGRFTSYLAQKARHVLAVDFVDKFIEKNKETNISFKNIDYVVDDVMNLQLSPESAGFIFTNWFFMYFDDNSARSLLEKMLSWLPVNGHIFLRESCVHGSGDISLNNATTHYRETKDYEALFLAVTLPTEDKESVYGFTVTVSRPVETFRKVMRNENQITWLLQKARRDAYSTNTNP